MKYTAFLFKFIWACILTLVYLIGIPFTFMFHKLFLFLWDFKYYKYNFEYLPEYSIFNISPYNTNLYVTYKTYFHYIWDIRPEEKETAYV
jgi:hypothetical protein